MVETSRKWSARFWLCAARSGKEKKKKSRGDYGESRHHPYLITVAKPTHGLVWLTQFHHLMSPALPFLPSFLPHLFHFPLPLRLSRYSMWWWWWGGGGKKGHKPNQGNRYERCKQRYQISPQLSPTSHGYTEEERRGAFLRASGETKKKKKTYHQSNFPLSPPNKAICVRNTCIIHLRRDGARGEHRRPKREARQLPGVGAERS